MAHYPDGLNQLHLGLLFSFLYNPKIKICLVTVLDSWDYFLRRKPCHTAKLAVFFQRTLAMTESEATEQLIRPSTEEEDDSGMKPQNLRKRRQNKTKSNLEGPKGLYSVL